MIIATDAVTRTGNVDATTAVACTFDTEGIGHIMSILSNMYSNATLAVLREYSCNAADSHVAAGQTRPIEVTLPSPLQPSLLIQDYGTGLSKDEIISVYATYGKSTKRNTNDQVGALGIGSKSAFTLGQQFVVTGIKDGQKTVALFALNEHNVGTVNILQEHATTEPNGVLISLAVSDIEAMRATADEFFRTWPKGSVLVNGRAPESIFDTGFAITENAHVVENTRGGVSVIMGGVGYPVSRDILLRVSESLDNAGRAGSRLAGNLASLWGTRSMYYTVNIGDVDIAPSRESLRDTNRTVACIENLIEATADRLLKSVEERVDAASTWFEALSALNEATDLLKGFDVDLSRVTWHGKALKDLTLPIPFFYLAKKSYRSSKMELRSERTFHLDVARSRRTLVVTGVSEADRGRVSRFARRFLESREDVDFLLVTSDHWGEQDWFSFGTQDAVVPSITLAEYQAELRTLRSTSPRPAASETTYSWNTYRRQDKADRFTLAEILDEGKPIALFLDDLGYRNDVSDAALAGYTTITLLANQSEQKFRERIGDALEVVSGLDVIRAYAQRLVDSITAEQREGLAARRWLDAFRSTGWSEVVRYYGHHADKILNEEFLSVLENHTRAVEVSHQADDVQPAIEAARILGATITINPGSFGSIPSLRNDYPLLPTGYYGPEQSLRVTHGIAYLNGLALSS